MAQWFENYRMAWIAETLQIFGFINRDHLKRKFGISTPQASKDLNEFLRRNPKSMFYNMSMKCYQANREAPYP